MSKFSLVETGGKIIVRVPYEALYQELRRNLLEMGFRRDRAELSAKLFADASQDGVYSHGLNRFPRFVETIQQGFVDIHAAPEKIDSFGALERWDGHLGPGNLNAYYCMNRAISLARESGIGCVALQNTNHWMRGGSYGWQAADADIVGVCWSNTKPNLPPWGARDARLGNNPLVIAIPRTEGHVVLDMAMSLFSYGKLEAHRLREEPLPVDGGFDREGHLTRDPSEIEASARPLPIGFWKGSGLSMVLDLVAALLSGGRATHQIVEEEYSLSQVFIAVDPTQFKTSDSQGTVVEEVITYLHEATPSQEGGSVYYPGERSLLTRKENMEMGIPVEPSIWHQVQAMNAGK